MDIPLVPKFPRVGEADFWRKAAVYDQYMKDKDDLKAWEEWKRLRGKYET